MVFAGSRPLTRTRLSLLAVLGRAVALRSGTLEELAIQVVRPSSEELPCILGDPLLLQQAFLNILINAEQAIVNAGTGGRIEVSASRRQKTNSVMVTIRDTGPGIAPAVLPRVFEPFFTTKDVGQGSGLGLAITYGIIQKHGGDIQAGNAPDGGAVFTVELPVADSIGKLGTHLEHADG